MADETPAAAPAPQTTPKRTKRKVLLTFTEPGTTPKGEGPAKPKAEPDAAPAPVTEASPEQAPEADETTAS